MNEKIGCKDRQENEKDKEVCVTIHKRKPFVSIGYRMFFISKKLIVYYSII